MAMLCRKENSKSDLDSCWSCVGQIARVRAMIGSMNSSILLIAR